MHIEHHFQNIYGIPKQKPKHIKMKNIKKQHQLHLKTSNQSLFWVNIYYINDQRSFPNLGTKTNPYYNT